ncbi:sigma-70 family RNA polymerase sigma factor [Mesobacillus harenae]|uniref:sigma-70 family RNA polymerase sigma factor n=1 Tax=Mesobacillus harenae TaxID=2213203 RepID=UPI001580E071|nr:sigma-70 family RNA polymerase sigma factor [Mesobacillus harenae]
MESFEQVTTQYTPMIHKIMNSLNIYTNKDEFFQLGLISLWEAYNRFDPEKGGFTNYAYTYIKGKFLTEMTQTNKRNEYQVSAAEEFWDYVVDELTTCPLEEEILLSYCKSSQLTENQTKWVIYYCLKGFDTKEIAEIEQVSLSAVKNWKAGAKEKLKLAIQAEG